MKAASPEGAAGRVSLSRPRSLLSNGAWNLLLSLSQTAVTFLLTPFVIARIGSVHYGLLVLLLTISGFMGLMNLGLGEATLRYVAHHYDRGDLHAINRVVGATSLVHVAAGALGWALLHFAAPSIAGALRLPPAELPLATTLLGITAVNFGLGFAAGACGSIPQALRRHDLSAGVLIAQSLFHAAGTVGILLAGLGVRELVAWGVATTVFTQALNVVVARRLIPGIRLRPVPSGPGLREVFGYGMFSLLTNLLGLLWGQADRLILGAVAGTAAVAHLAVPQQLSFRGTGAVASLGAGLFPKFSGALEPEEQRRLFLAATWAMLGATAALFVPLTALFPDVLRLWVGEEFAARSAWLAQVVAFSCIVRGAFVPYDALFRGVGRPQYLTLVFAGTAATSLLLNLWLIPRYGLAGAGYCYAATTVWGFGAIGFAWKRVLAAASALPLARTVLAPVLVAWLALGLCVQARSWLPDPGWLGLIALFAAGGAVTGALIVGVELLLGGRGSLAAEFLRALRRLLPALRAPGAVVSP